MRRDQIKKWAKKGSSICQWNIYIYYTLYFWWLNSGADLVWLIYWSNGHLINIRSCCFSPQCSCCTDILSSFSPTSSPFRSYLQKWPFGERGGSVRAAERRMFCLLLHQPQKQSAVSFPPTVLLSMHAASFYEVRGCSCSHLASNFECQSSLVGHRLSFKARGFLTNEIEPII